MKTVTKNVFTREQIRRLVNKHFPGAEITSVRTLKGGTFNTLYQIEGTGGLEKGVVLKTSPIESVGVPNHEKDILRAEIYAYQLLKHVKIPIPKIYVYDFSRKVIPCDYFIMERIKGKSWYELWPGKNPELMRALGRYTARIHSVEYDWFGDINHAFAGRFSTWGKAFTFMVDDVLYEISKQGGKLPYKEIRSAIYSRRELLDTVKTPVLVNFDMWAGNVFLSQKRTSSISAIIDFERSFFGDPLAAFVSALFIYDDVEKETDFIAGYNEVSKRPLILTSGDREKMILYEMLLYLSSYCETQRYNFWMRNIQRLSIQSLILYDLRRLKKLSMKNRRTVSNHKNHIQ